MPTTTISQSGDRLSFYYSLHGDPALLVTGDANYMILFSQEWTSSYDGPVVVISGARNYLRLETGAAIIATGEVAVQGSDHRDEIFNNRGSRIVGHVLLGDGDDYFQNGDNSTVGDVFGGTGNDVITTYNATAAVAYFGEAGDDGLIGGSAADHLEGGDGADILYGNAGGDILIGGGGADRLAGGLGDDILTGGGQGDTAIFTGFAADFSCALSGGAGTVTDQNADDGDQGADTLSGISVLRFTDQQIELGVAFDTLVLTAAGEHYTNVADRYGLHGVTLQGDGATFVNEAEIRGTGVPHWVLLANGYSTPAATAALAVLAEDVTVENRAGASIVGIGDALSNMNQVRDVHPWPDGHFPGLGLRVINDGTILSSEGIAVNSSNGVDLVNGATGIIDGGWMGVQVSNGSMTIVNDGLIRGEWAAIRGSFITLDNRGTIDGQIHTDAWSRLRNGGTIDGGYDAWGGVNVVNSGESSGNLEIHAMPIGWHYLPGYTHSEIENHGSFTGNITISGEVQFHAAPTSHQVYRAIFVNTGTLTGDIVSDVTYETFGDGSKPDASFVEEITNSGTIDGDVRLGDGDDRLVNSGTVTGAIEGGSGDDLLDGGVGALRLSGGGGDDVLVTRSVAPAGAAASVDGGEGFDRATFDRAASAVAYRIDLALATQEAGDGSVLSGVEALEFLGGAGDDRVSAGSAADLLSGGGGGDRLTGRGGHDRIDGGDGADVMTGGTGNDIYFVNHKQDEVVEASGEGVDSVHSAVSFRLAGTVEHLYLTGTTAIDGTGNAQFNMLYGNAAANRLDGGAGADRMSGGDGDDSYIVDDVGDRVLETSASGGRDTVYSSVGFNLAYLQIERLFLTGSAAVNAFGNSLANTLVGNGNHNLLDGGGGIDVMNGGSGNDTYVVDSAGESVIEAVNGGVDTVLSAVTFHLARAYEIENLTLTGNAAINATGNHLSNRLRGNGADNVLNGSSGADTMIGGGGNDTYVVDDAGDRAVESDSAGGIDTVRSSVSFSLAYQFLENLTLTGSAGIDARGNSLANSLVGNAGANNLFGGGGHDVLRGGAGADGFWFDTSPNAGSNVDRILDFSVADDTIHLSRSVFRAIGADGTLAASAFSQGPAAADASDRIVHDRASGNIFYDADGSGGGAAILFAAVAAGTALTHLDFSAYTPGC